MTRTDEEPAGGIPSGSSESTTTRLLGLEEHGNAQDGPRQALNGDDPWKASCWQTGIAYWAALGRAFTADDVHALGVPMPDNPNTVGGLFAGARQAGQIRPVGFRSSHRCSRRGGVQREWIGTTPVSGVQADSGHQSEPVAARPPTGAS